MWIVAKIKNNNAEIFKKEFLKKFSDKKVVFYEPKFICTTYFKGKKILKKKSLLENYMFCKHETFKKINLNSLKFTKGLSFFLDGCVYSQESINNFINNCRSHEDNSGFIQNSFFKIIVDTKGKFISGPFKNLVFNIIKKNNNNLKISIGKFFFTVSDKIKYIYRPV